MASPTKPWFEANRKSLRFRELHGRTIEVSICAPQRLYTQMDVFASCFVFSLVALVSSHSPINTTGTIFDSSGSAAHIRRGIML